ncbi:MAG: transporter substrate-binding domain-containing protein [Segniliparus sp.]|uniref:transporter substrate-binding domain-containing protein n=1 Tax=Segniliparus sp. TaxID=2804064 RepID=UPI003F2A2498
MPASNFRVGVSRGFLGLSEIDPATGEWAGFDVDVARAVAVALFGSESVLEFVPLSSAERFEALASGEVDLGCFNATTTSLRELVEGVVFSPPTLHDGEVFATRASNLEDAGEPVFARAKSRRVAVLNGSTTLVNVEQYSREQGVDFIPVFYDLPSEALAGYRDGAADVVCLDSFLLAGELARLGEAGHVLLDDEVTLEPMAPAVSIRRPELATAVRWVVHTLVEAERLGISQESLRGGSAERADHGGYVSQFLDGGHLKGRESILRPGFVRDVVGAVGNYADVFHRNLGAGSALNLDRKKNRLAQFGGLLHSPRFI